MGICTSRRFNPAWASQASSIQLNLFLKFGNTGKSAKYEVSTDECSLMDMAHGAYDIRRYGLSRFKSEDGGLLV